TLEDEPTKSLVQLVDGHADRLSAPPALSQAASWPPVVRLTGGLQVSQNGEHTPVILCGGREPELREDARHVLFDGTEGDHHLLRDRLVRPALGHRLQHLALARGQLLERIVTPASPDELRDDGGVERRSALRDT